MNTIVTILVFGLCLAGMAIGFIFSKKVLKRGCSTDPEDCACRKEEKDPEKCDK